MSFNSITFAIFLPIVFIIYWALPSKYRWILLFAASYYFYMSWNPKYVVLILFTTFVSYICGILLEKTEKKSTKNWIVFTALILCLGVLFVFKYYNFAVTTIAMFCPFSPRLLDLILPVGISFYTFQTLSYVIDIYKGEVKAERNFGVYATFVSFFPQLVAGPIERSSRLLPQIRQEHKFDVNNANTGIRLIVWGLFKKIVIADNYAFFADNLFAHIRDFKGFSLFMASFFFLVQVYCDFSGYSDIARGSAKLFGIELMINFRSPFFSTSVKELWSRWHISLSTWFRDYIYFPLGGSRKGKLRHCLNILIVFVTSGLWHGASWNLAIWGGLHGLAQIFENIYGIQICKKRDVYAHIRMVFVFIYFVWVTAIFRAQNFSDAIYIYANMLTGVTHPVQYVMQGLRDFGFDASYIVRFIVYIVPLAVIDYISLDFDVIEWIGTKKAWVRHAFLIVFIALTLCFGFFGKSSFVYFQF